MESVKNIWNILMRIVAVFAASGLSVIGAGAIAGISTIKAVTVAIPGAQALADAYVALANIGNDMSPITRKKAKKVLVLTAAVVAFRRRFGND